MSRKGNVFIEALLGLWIVSLVLNLLYEFLGVLVLKEGIHLLSWSLAWLYR